eukprot:TRINITY_DN16299_c0_g1_i1.p1 TRINITY_DN16299_c0_g1~~TRINITY_DN16299_c0_g1_i1.p1  ORF type:complete len:458 (-),score=26.30 TRINITY_DN16299_c0_g1_i1:133-1506(-)
MCSDRGSTRLQCAVNEFFLLPHKDCFSLLEGLVASGALQAEAFSAAVHRRRFLLTMSKFPIESASPVQIAGLHANGLLPKIMMFADLDRLTPFALTSRAMLECKKKVDVAWPRRLIMCDPDETQCYDAPSDTWCPLPAMTIRRSRGTACVLHGLLYICGGIEPTGGVSRAVESFDPLRQEWSVMTPMAHARAGAVAAAVRDKLYVCGGYAVVRGGGWEACPSECLDISSEVWSPAPSTQQRVITDVAVLGGSLYAYGKLGRLMFDTVECFDPVGQTWTFLPPMLQRRHYGNLTAAHGMLYVCGGEGDRFDATNTAANPSASLATAERFNPREDAWERLPQMSHDRSFCPVLAASGSVYIFGGREMSDDDTIFTAECFDSSEHAWTLLPPMQSLKSRMRANVANGLFYVSGYDVNEQFATEVFDPVQRTWSILPRIPGRRNCHRLIAVLRCLKTTTGE